MRLRSKVGCIGEITAKAISVGPADTLIAATVEHHQTTLVTLNHKHFPMLLNVVVPYQKP